MGTPSIASVGMAAFTPGVEGGGAAVAGGADGWAGRVGGACTGGEPGRGNGCGTGWPCEGNNGAASQRLRRKATAMTELYRPLGNRI